MGSEQCSPNIRSTVYVLQNFHEIGESDEEPKGRILAFWKDNKIINPTQKIITIPNRIISPTNTKEDGAEGKTKKKKKDAREGRLSKTRR
jgi:hypothetical protein